MDNKNESKSLRFLYKTSVGRAVLKVLTCRGVSKLCGAFLDSRASKFLIKGFVKNNGIDLSEYETAEYKNFNQFFSRKIKPENRPIDMSPNVLISPCDGLLSAYKITDGLVLPVKQSKYTVDGLLQNKELAQKYNNGLCLVFRLCVNHYHRYCYVDNGKKGDNFFIKGKLHTVRPIALGEVPVFTENCREYTVMETENFGTVTEVEVGAMLVGKISNNHKTAEFFRGDEKGKFLYGGSTIILLLSEDEVSLCDEILENTKNNIETPIKMGQPIGYKK